MDVFRSEGQSAQDGSLAQDSQNMRMAAEWWDRMGSGWDRMGLGWDRIGSNGIWMTSDGVGLGYIGIMGTDVSMR